MPKRNLYLNNTPVEEALQRYFNALNPTLKQRTETIPVIEALGRITAAAVYARVSSPLFNAAAMDGIAVVAGHTSTASEINPLQLTEGRDFIVVDTGDPVYDPYDAVIMAEDVHEISEEAAQIIASAAPWQHIRPVGEDIVAGEMILPGYHRIRAIDIGVLLSGGITKLDVHKKPVVAIIPTGSEMVEPDQVPQGGQIIESNSRMFEALATENGGLACRLPIVADDFALLKDAVGRAVREHDLVIVNAGSSAGTEDYTVHILRELGEVVVHGVAIKPGKPVILAIVDGKPVIGLPGYPVSAYIGFVNFVVPVLERLTGAVPQSREQVWATVTKRLVSSLKHREYVRVKAGLVRDKLVCTPLARGAGAAMSLVRADGFCVIEQNSEGVEAGSSVELDLYRPLSDVGHTVVAIGSHDLILDEIADLMPNLFRGMHLSSTHVGSMAGLMALQRSEAHIAPTHLLDEESGIYNEPYLRRIFSGRKIALIKGVNRVQGLMVPAGNPLRIKGIGDLPGKRYINRQRGAGTRVLLDYLLKKARIDPGAIAGYEREAATHMAVAAAVHSGSADAGMGIRSAAKAMGLDFIEIGPEEYDFAIFQEDLALPHLRAFLEVLQCPQFHRRLQELGGYTAERCGEIVMIE